MLSSRPSRVPLEECFPVAYTVNSLPTLNLCNAQCRKGPNCGGSPPQCYPNNIHIPEINRYGAREEGQCPEEEGEIPEWMHKPIGPRLNMTNTDGDITQQNPLWI